MNNRRLTEEQIAEVCRRYAEGQENLAQLGRDFGVSADTIVSYLKNRGVKRPGKIGSKPKLTEEQSAEVCRRYAEERESTDQLAMAFGVSKNTIASRLKSRGIGMRTGNVGAKPKLTEEQVAEICRRYAEGRENLAQLARTFGVDPKTITNYLKREGVKRPGRHAGIIRLTERQIAEICRRYVEGQKNLTQLGRDFGVSATSIASHLKSRGIKRPGKVGGSLKLTEEQVAEICRRYVEERQSMMQLARAFGVKAATIARYLGSKGIKRSGKAGARPKLTEAQIAEVCRRYAEGRENLAQLGRDFGVSAGSIANCLKNNGVKRPGYIGGGSSKLTEEQITEVCRRYVVEGQENFAQLGRDFGVSADTIARYLKNRGVKRAGKIVSRPKLTEAQIAEVCRRYVEGQKNLAQLGRDFGVSATSIANHLKIRGVRQLGRSGSLKLTEEQITEVCRRYVEERESMMQLGRDFGVSENTIASYLKNRGVKRTGRIGGGSFKLTEEQIAEICRRYVEGQKNLAQLGRDFGVSATSIANYLKIRGVRQSGRSGSLKLTEEQITEVCRRYVEEQETAAQLGRDFGVSENTIASYLKNRGVKRPGKIGGRPKLTEEQIAEVCRRYVEEDESQPQLAKAFGVSADTIARHLKNRGVKRLGKSPRLKLKAEQIAEICSRYISGAHIGELARAFGVSENTIARYLKISGVELSERPTLNEQQVAEMCRRYEAGDSLDRLAKSYGISLNKIKHRLKTAGTKLRGRIERFSRWLKRDEWMEICRRYQEGEDIDQLAEYFKVNPRTIKRHLKAGSVMLREADRDEAGTA